MSNDYRDPAFKKWLDKLQQESWQLELIISGFAIYGLFTAYEPLRLALRESIIVQNIYSTGLLMIGFIACSILLFNLLVHVILRGLWIGALGLRYVSGDIDFDQLNYHGKFDRFLRRRIGSYDKFIAKLEDYCSILFAVSFLLIFYFLGMVILLLCIVFTAIFVIGEDGTGEDIREVIGIIMVLTILVGSFITLVDFLTQGFLKRKKWLSFIYYPIYRLFSLLTLSFLYRPLVYNFLDNKFGKRLLWVLIPVYGVIIYVATLNYQVSNYFDLDQDSSSVYASHLNYEDQIESEGELVQEASIPSKVIETNYINLFVPHSESIEDYLMTMNPGLRPDNDIRGLTSNIELTGDGERAFNSWQRRDSLRQVYLKTFNDNYFVVVDSLVTDAEFVVTSNKRKQLGFETFINIKNLAPGKHTLKVRRLFLRNGDTLYNTRTAFPFWYFEN